jgi:hypothetical protein
MVTAVRAGCSVRAVARQFRVSLLTVQRWVQRAGRQRLDRVDWSDRSHRPRRIRRTAPELEERVVTLRSQLRDESDLGEFGARAIHRALLELPVPRAPAVRTIGRILERRGVLDGRQRLRRPPPPPGWYVPAVAAGQVELDSFDIVEGLVIAGGLEVEVLNGVSLHGGLPVSWPGPPVRATMVVEALTTHWRTDGLPTYAQFDNDTCFQGAHQFPDTLGRVTRCCLSLGVVPIFVPPQEPGFQAAIENYNGRWQAKVWARFRHADYHALQRRSARYVAALRQRLAPRLERAPTRHRFPQEWHLDLQARPRGRLIFIRRADERGRVEVLGHRWAVATHWGHRLIRAEVDLETDRIRFYALRRRAPAEQPLLLTQRYHFPRTGFRE